MEELKSVDKRFCCGCGSNKTFVNKRGSEDWCTNLPTDLVLCKSCAEKYIHNPRRREQGYHRQYIRFRKGQIKLSSNPRKGICSLCHRKNGDKYFNSRGEPKTIQTTMHHLEYHEGDPLKDTIELCRDCHPKEDWRLGKYANRPNNHQPHDPITGAFISRGGVI